MPSLSQRALTGISLAAALCGWSSTSRAQYFNDPCACQPITAVQAPVVIQQAIANPCACMVPQTVMEQRQVQTTQLVPEQRPQKVLTYKTAMREQDVVQYRTVNETRTANVQQMSYQTVTECRPMTVNQSYWRTAIQPVPKMASCAYDPRPGMLGAMNRFGWDMRMAFTPNYIPRREFVPNVTTYNQPVQRVVAVPTTRQVTYNVARLEPYTVKQQVAVQEQVWEERMVTVMVPKTVTQTVSVPVTRMVAFDAFGSTTAALNPTPATTAQGSSGTQTSESGKGAARLQSAPGQEIPLRQPTYPAEPTPADAEPTPADVEPRGPVANSPKTVPSAVRVAGWRTSRSKAAERNLNGPELPELKVAQK